MTQFLRPDSNITQTGFTGGFSAIDESIASDVDFAFGADGGGNILEVGLTNPANNPATGTSTVRYRVAKTSSGSLSGNGNSVTGTLSIYQGGTLIASDTARTLTGSWTTYTWSVNLSSVTDWTDVRVRFEDSSNGGNPNNRRAGAISWVEVEVPEGLAGLTGSLSVQETGTDTLAASGTVTDPAILGTFSVQESGNDVLSSTGSVAISGELSVAESGVDTSTGSGQVAISGTLGVQEQTADTASFSGQVSITGSLSVQEDGADIATFSSEVSSPDVTGSLSATESGTDTFSSLGEVTLSATLSVQETGTDTANLIGAIPVGVVFSVTESGTDSVQINGVLPISGTLSVREVGQDIFRNFVPPGQIKKRTTRQLRMRYYRR